MIDADNFKAINDQYGHNAGDQAIKAVSKAIQSCIRPDDIFIRYGGDEFVLIFQDIHYDAFTTRLYQISECVKRTKVDDYEDLPASNGYVSNITYTDENGNMQTENYVDTY